MTESERITIFCEEIWAWFAVHKRTLPWRDLTIKNDDERAYRILVSEVMLQQTQVSRVIGAYTRFLETFPTLTSLSEASDRNILLIWRGMGYNSRALRLRDAAHTIVTTFDGHVPRDLEVLMTIKGIGRYTASAILNFAFGIPTPCIDTNIRRILHRFFVGPENSDGTWKKNDSYLNDLAEKVLMTAVETYPKTLHRAHTTIAAEWHAALMDFGSLVSTKNNPKWELMNHNMKSICKAYGKEKVRTKKLIKIEPGREVGGRHIPNRIFRGRIVELLRDHPRGLKSDIIGKNITNDWTMGDHKKWLEGVLVKLERDGLVRKKGATYRLP